MDSNTEEQIKEALAILTECGVGFMLMVDAGKGVTCFSNSKADRLFIVGQEEQ
jgi:hypothetical protein